jgi:hypothetical protein
MSVVKTAKIVNYVLHATHGKLDKKLDKLETVIGEEEFVECVKLANNFFN